MGNKFQFGHTVVNYTVSATNEDANYPASNLKLYNHLRRAFRSINTGATTISITSGAGALIYLTDCNFTAVKINGVDYVVSKDLVTQRYSICVVMTVPASFTIIPSSPIAGATYYKIGTLVIMTAVFEPARNPFYTLGKKAPKQYRKRIFSSGGHELIKLGDYKKSEHSFYFDASTKADLWALDAIDQNAYVVFFENLGDSSRAWLCRRAEPIEVLETSNNYYKSGQITYEEVI